MKKIADEIHARDIYLLIYKQFKRKGYSVFPQVRNHQGQSDIRIADAIAISQSALRSTSFIGFEIKVSKSDFRSELANPEKADAIAQYCNKWFVVAPKGIISPNEVPEKWGLIEATKTQLRMTKGASELPCVQPTREFVATIVRKAEGGAALQSTYWRGYEDGKRQNTERKEDILRERSDELQKLREAVKIFEKNSGVNLFYWNNDETKRIGWAVGLIKEGSVVYKIKGIEKTLENLLGEVRAALKELETNPLKIEEASA